MAAANYRAMRLGPFKLAPAVTLTKHETCDMYEGSAQALVDSGIVEMHELPGQPGRSPHSVGYRPLGVPRKKSWSVALSPGYTYIRRCGVADKYIVFVNVTDDERANRKKPLPAIPAAPAADESLLLLARAGGDVAPELDRSPFHARVLPAPKRRGRKLDS